MWQLSKTSQIARFLAAILITSSVNGSKRLFFCKSLLDVLSFDTSTSIQNIEEIFQTILEVASPAFPKGF